MSRRFECKMCCAGGCFLLLDGSYSMPFDEGKMPSGCPMGLRASWVEVVHIEDDNEKECLC